MHRDEVPGRFGIRLQRLAQPNDVRIHRPRVGRRIVSPHRVQQHAETTFMSDSGTLLPVPFGGAATSSRTDIL
jgi:hypothetical protein